MRWLAIVLLSMACATGGDGPGGGGLNLPSNDYFSARVPEGPDALDLEDASISRPWGYPSVPGPLVWFGVVTAEGTDIHLSVGEERETGWTFGPPERVLANADQPSVVRRDDRFVMAFVRDGAIALATSTAGTDWEEAGPVLTPSLPWEGADLGWPSLVDDPESGRTLLFYLSEGGTGVGLAAAPLGESTFERVSDTPIFGPAPPAAPVEGEDPPEPAWDEGPLSGVSVTRQLTPIGRRQFAMYYSTGARGGYAAAFEPTEWVRSALNPVLVPDTSGTALAEPMRAGPLLLHTRKAQADSDRRALAVAVFGYTPPPQRALSQP